jgi:hypothetical protein
MKPILNKYFWCLATCFMLAACAELDVVPTNKYTDETYWTSEANASSLLNMAYRQMNNPGWVFRDERLSDNLYNGYGNDDARVTSNGLANSSTVMFNNMWADIYAGIKTTHTFLANVDRVPNMNESKKERMKAEARFIRAFLYFQATNWFGDVPFFTEDIDLPTSQTISPTAQATIVAFIHDELDAIAEILPTRTEYSQDDRGRITSGAAMALNARVALNFNDWAKVKECTEKLINGTEYGTYALFPNYQELFFRANQYNEEIILDIQYVTDFRTWGEISTYVPFSLPGVQYIQACPTQDLVDTYLMKDGSKWNETKDAYADRDPRFDMTIIHDGSSVTRKDGTTYVVNVDPNDTGNNTNDRINRENGGQTGYFYRKYYDPNPLAWTGGSSWSCNINFVTIRYADVLLMYAEAMNELDQMNATVWDKTIKALRQRAGFDNTALALDFPGGGKEDLRQIIRDERRVELALEGQRIYDIRRWKIAETVLNQPRRGAKFRLNNGNLEYFTYGNNTFNPNRDYLWPVPRQQWTINQNLGQNPGY